MSFDREDDEAVGYKRPPRWARFQEGRSGNPKGRPKKRRETANEPVPQTSWLDEAHRAEMSREIIVNDAQGSRRIPMLEVILKSQANAAATGNVNAQKEILRQQRAVERHDAYRREAAEQAELARQKQAAETFDNIVTFKSIREREWNEALCQGRDEPDEPWPHPDDILIDRRNRTWRIRGPFDERDLSYYEYLVAERDAAFMVKVRAVRWGGKAWQFRSRLYSHICLWYDFCLPLRWQINERIEQLELGWLIKPTRAFKEAEAECEAMVERLRAIFATQESGSKEAYRYANEAMKPLLKRMGYRSLAHFERIHENG